MLTNVLTLLSWLNDLVDILKCGVESMFFRITLDYIIFVRAIKNLSVVALFANLLEYN